MASYYIDQQPGIGYVVTQLDTANLDDGYLSNRHVRNFGDRQTDAIEFRDDCNNGKIDPRRITIPQFFQFDLDNAPCVDLERAYEIYKEVTSNKHQQL